MPARRYRYWWALACDTTCTKVAASTQTEESALWISSNSGASWTAKVKTSSYPSWNQASTKVTSIDVSSDGQTILAGVPDNGVASLTYGGAALISKDGA